MLKDHLLNIVLGNILNRLCRLTRLFFLSLCREFESAWIIVNVEAFLHIIKLSCGRAQLAHKRVDLTRRFSVVRGEGFEPFRSEFRSGFPNLEPLRDRSLWTRPYL